MADFEADLDAWCDQVEAKMDQVFRGIAEAALGRVKANTPVDTGLLRSAWSIVGGEEAVPVKGRAGAAVNEEALAAALSSAKAGDVLRIVNPVIYARAVEYGREIQKKDGTTVHVAGAGMLTRTVAELPEIAQGVIAEVAGGRAA